MGTSVQEHHVGVLFGPIPSNRIMYVFRHIRFVMMQRLGAALLMWMVLACPVACWADWRNCAALGGLSDGCCPADGCAGGAPAAGHSHHAPADHCAAHGCLCAGALTLRHEVQTAGHWQPLTWLAGLCDAGMLDRSMLATGTRHWGNLILPVASGRHVRLLLASLVI